MCKHKVWEIETTTASLARGVCKKCGVERMFPNQISPSMNPNVLKDVQSVGANNPAYWERYVEFLARDL